MLNPLITRMHLNVALEIATGKIFDLSKNPKKEHENLQNAPKVTIGATFFNPRGVGYYFIGYIYKRDIQWEDRELGKRL